MNDEHISSLGQRYDAALEFIRKLDRLTQFQERIAIDEDLEKIWQLLLEEIRGLIENEVCAVFGVDETTHDFVLREISDPLRQDLCEREIELQIDCGIFSWVVNRRQPSLLPSLALKDPQTTLLLPLSTLRNTLGVVLVMTSQDPSAVTGETVKLLAMLARQCSLVMENVLLYNRLRREHQHLQEAQAQIIQAEKLASIGRLTSGASHEILNPLNIISGYVQLLLRGAGVDARAKKRLEEMRRQCDRIARVVKGLMRFSAEEAGEIRDDVDLNAVIRDALALVEPELRFSLVVLSLDLQQDLPVLRGDRDALSQMFLHILTNAREAMPDGGALEVSTRVFARRGVGSGAPDAIEVKIRDTGPGIPAGLQARIFEPFVTFKASGDGMGLGLYLSYCVVQGHGGRIGVESEEGHGTCVAIVLPLGGVLAKNG